MATTYTVVSEKVTGAQLARIVRKSTEAVYIRPRGPWGSYKGFIRACEAGVLPNKETWLKGDYPAVHGLVSRTFPERCTFRVYIKNGEK